MAEQIRESWKGSDRKMTENESKQLLTDKQKKIATAAIIGTLVLGSGAIALTNRDKGTQSKNEPKVSKVSRVKDSSGNKSNKSKGNESSDSADSVFSTYGLDLPTTNDSSDYTNSSKLSPSEIQTMANTLGSDRGKSSEPQLAQTIFTDPTPKVTKPAAKETTNSGESNNKIPAVDENNPTPPIVVVPEQPDVTPPEVVTTTPTIEILKSEVILQEGQTFNPTAYFIVHDSGDPAPTITYSKTDLVPGRNEIQIYATNKFGNKASASLVVIVNRAPMLVAKENVVDVSIHTTPDLKSFITAEDPEEGNLMDKVEVTGNPDTTKEGTYTIVYNVSDSQGGSATPVSITINVVNEAPKIHVSDREVSISDDSIDLLEGISVSDMEDDRDGFPISISQDNIIEGEVDMTTEGEYRIKVGNVKDRDGKAAEDVEFTIKVTNLAPEVSVPLLELNVGDTFDQTAYKNSISFSDKEDSKLGLTPTLEVSQSDMDAISTDQPGEFTVSIKVTDSSGKATSILGVVKVI